MGARTTLERRADSGSVSAPACPPWLSLSSRPDLSALAALAALTAFACAATPGTSEDPVPPDEPIVLRPLPPEALARKAIAYSGYRTGQSPEIQKYPSKQEIADDLRLLARGGWTFLRLFDAGVRTPGARPAGDRRERSRT